MINEELCCTTVVRRSFNSKQVEATIKDKVASATPPKQVRRTLVLLEQDTYSLWILPSLAMCMPGILLAQVIVMFLDVVYVTINRNLESALTQAICSITRLVKRKHAVPP